MPSRRQDLEVSCPRCWLPRSIQQRHFARKEASALLIDEIYWRYQGITSTACIIFRQTGGSAPRTAATLVGLAVGPPAECMVSPEPFSLLEADDFLSLPVVTPLDYQPLHSFSLEDGIQNPP